MPTTEECLHQLDFKDTKNPTPREITRRYRQLVLKRHPDKGGTAELFQELNKAYRHLQDNTYGTSGTNTEGPKVFYPPKFRHSPYNKPEYLQEHYNQEELDKLLITARDFILWRPTLTTLAETLLKTNEGHQLTPTKIQKLARQSHVYITDDGAEAIKECIQKKIHDPVGAGNKMLQLVSESSHGQPTIEALLEAGAHSETEDAEGNTALMHAASFGCLSDVKLLWHAGVDINHENHKGDTALIKATACPKLDVIQWLIKQGADPKQRDSNGWSIGWRYLYSVRVGNAIWLLKYAPPITKIIAWCCVLVLTLALSPLLLLHHLYTMWF